MVVKPDGKTFWGMSIDGWVKIFQSLGVPTLFMIFFCYLAWEHLPPIATAHIELLRRTGDTLESMDETLTQSNKMLEQLATQQYPSIDWRTTVLEQHETAQKDIDEIKAGVNKLNGAQ